MCIKKYFSNNYFSSILHKLVAIYLYSMQKKVLFTVKSLSLLYFLYLDLYVLGDDALIS